MSDQLKREAAIAALDEIKSGMVVGLGTGSTAAHFIRELGARVRAGLRIQGIPTSEASRQLAEEYGVPLTTFAEHSALDVTVDGADEVSPSLDLIKGLGGALVREKLVARASARLVIVVDSGKLVERLGSRAPIPVEIVPFALDVVRNRLEKMGGEVRVRQQANKPFVSDNGNLVLDWGYGEIGQPDVLEQRLKSMTGVVDCGIFANLARRVIVADPTGIRTIDRAG
jgi:ribose 5-phosphate isomerase A